DQERLDHRQVRGDRAAIVEEARVIEAALGVVDVFLVERPADALDDAALDLTLDIARVDRGADVLGGDEAQDLDRARLRIDLDITELRREAWGLAAGIDRCG